MEARLLRAVAYRRTALRAMCLAAMCGIVMAAVLALAARSWIVMAAGVIVTVELYLLTLIDVAERLERVTGLSRRQQSLLVTRYRVDQTFAAHLDRALAEYGIWNALDDVVRPPVPTPRPLDIERWTPRPKVAPRSAQPLLVGELLTQRSEHVLRRM